MEPSDAVRLKVELQSQGVRLAIEDAKGRVGGAGPAEGITLFFEELIATVPACAAFVSASPFTLEERGAATVLVRDGSELCRVEVAAPPAYYSRKAGGVAMEKIALRHGRDCIGSTVAQSCARAEPCLFCGISLSRKAGATIARKSPGDLGEVAAAAWDEGFSQAVLTTGTTDLEECGIPLLVSCSEAVKRSTGGGMEVHVQFEPPEDLALIDRAASSADSAAINLECFDEDTLARVAPGKAALGPDRYRAAWGRAVEAMGEGQVACFIIVGLGEPAASVLEGCRLLTSLGVFPYVLPLRPIPGTPMGSCAPPSASYMLSTYEAAAGIIESSGLSRKGVLAAGCVRCGACSAITDIL
jgi:radical SAM protein (TIGR04043 family)